MLPRTPPRRSPRLHNNLPTTSHNSMDNNNLIALAPNTEESRSATNITQPDMSTTAAITMPTSDTDSGITTNPSIDAHAAEASRNNMMGTPAHSSYDLNAMEQRLLVLESNLRATQVQLRERDVQNETLRAELFRSGSSAVTYASSAVAVSQPAPPQSTPALPPSTSALLQSTPAPPPGVNTITSQLYTGVRYDASSQALSQRQLCAEPLYGVSSQPTSQRQLYADSVYGVSSQPRIQRQLYADPLYGFSSQPTIQPNAFRTVSSANNLYTPFSINDAFSLHSPNIAMPPPNANAQMYPAPTYMPRKLLDLPEFSGRPEEWPVFYTAFVESTAMYGYSNFDNNQRLQKCLKGDAREMVKSLLIHPNNVSCIIEQLKSRFGRPEQLIRSQLQQVKEISPISETALGKLVPFATKVKNICAFLQSANADHHLANPMLLDDLICKLPMSKRIEWGRYAVTVQPRATTVHFSDWLTSLADVICSIQDESQFPGRESKRRVLLQVDEKQQQRKCPVCQGQHKPYECKRLLDASVAKRWAEVKSHHLCFACLNAGHSSRDCRQRKVCGIDGCNRMHSKLLHESQSVHSPVQSSSSTKKAVQSTSTQPSPPKQVPPAQVNHQPNDPSASVLSCAANSKEGKLLFRILPVTVYGKQRHVNTYALLDEGSSITMLDNTLAEELELSGQPHNLNVQWFGGHAVQEKTNLVDVCISGAGMSKKHKMKNVYVVKNLQLPSQSLSRSDLICDDKRMRQLPVQPQSSVVPRLLIGIDNCHLGIASKTIAMRKNGPYAANTELGWVVFGPSRNTTHTPATCLMMSINPDEALHNMVADFFETESFGVRAAKHVESDADVRARAMLEATTHRIGPRFETGLLWKEDNVHLPDSYDMALKRLVSVEKRMNRDTSFAAAYKLMISSYVEKGYARKLEHPDANFTTPRTWYLPHFPVTNPNKPNKLRIVFDAAAEVKGVSLNRHLMKGPQEYRPLPSILFHFREGAVGVCGDIKEMFHQVLVRPEDRQSQRFLWRDGDPERQPDTYEMCVMTFGAACSPCIAHYIKTRNALEHRNDNPCTARAVKAILDHHYVDDFVDSFDTPEEAIAVASQVKSIHMDAGFELRNFTSSSSEVIAALGGIDVTKTLVKKEGLSLEKVLGLYWQPNTDCFNFSLKFHNVSEVVLEGKRRPTKRELLSVVMSVFDPLGFIAHYVIGAKLLMREAWRQEASWDEPLPDYVSELWERWRNQLPSVTKYAIPRYYFHGGKPKELQLHIFADASENAFAAVAYWRSTNARGEVEVTFVCAKSKCAPLKPLTVPRLELQAAVLGTRLMQTVVEEHAISIDKCVLWSDSKTVINWIKSKNRRYKPFVQHRIAEILAATKVPDWKWIPTAENVADEATRTNNKVEFSPTSRWVNGPLFLRQPECAWPSQDIIATNLDGSDEELRPQYALTIVSYDFINFNRFSCLNRLVRTTAWVILFTKICRRQVQILSNCYGLTASDLEAAKSLLHRVVQAEAFSAEIEQIRSQQSISRQSSLLQLSPYIDEEGVLRVHGRIDAASWLPMEVRHPIILPPTHAFTKLVILHHHTIMGHQNTEATICSIRRVYWVPRLRSLLRSIIASCPVCRLRKAAPIPPLMGPLPIDRLTPYVRPFTYTGLDYFGPVYVTVRRSTEKRWVALFTCLTIRAVHLEIAHDLSTDSCITVIRNFINRRGVPQRLRSDNGKNFVGTNNEAKRFDEVFDCNQIQSELSKRGVEWLFNSPLNPAEGGAWERMVQSVKKILKQTMKEAKPREHTFNCFLIEAENIINSRPLTHLPIDANQEQPLTPNDFLLGSANTAHTPGTSDIITDTCVIRQQWRIARQLRDHFWKRWIAEYLPTLTRRVKWCQRTHPIQKGDLVFLCDPNVPRREWCRGVVEELYPGRDGEIRQVDVRTTAGVKRRAVSKLAVLDVSNDE